MRVACTSAALADRFRPAATAGRRCLRRGCQLPGEGEHERLAELLAGEAALPGIGARCCGAGAVVARHAHALFQHPADLGQTGRRSGLGEARLLGGLGGHPPVRGHLSRAEAGLLRLTQEPRSHAGTVARLRGHACDVAGDRLGDNAEELLSEFAGTGTQ